MPDYPFTWMMVFLRALGVVVFMPEFAGYSPPMMVRMGFTMLLATLVAGVVPLAHMPPDLWHLCLSAGSEVLLGLALGFVVRLIFAGVDFAGRLTSSEVGLAAAPGFAGPDISSAPLTSMLGAFAIILFFLFGGHLAVIGAFSRTFAFAGPGNASVSRVAIDQVVVGTAHVIELGVRIASPFIGLNFLVTLAFAALGRTLPRVQVYVVSMSIRALLGLALLASAGTLIARHLYVEFQALPERMLELVALR